MSEVEKKDGDEKEEEEGEGPVEVARRLREENREIYDKLADE